MLDLLWQTTANGFFRVILPLILLIVLVIVALRLVTLAASQIEKRFIVPVADPDRRARCAHVGDDTRKLVAHAGAQPQCGQA